MANMSIRGLDDKTLSKLKQQARREGASLNSLIVRLLRDERISKTSSVRPTVFDDLDNLAGTWSAQQAQAFARDTAAFSEVDPSLWK